ncbi:MAG: TIGR02147 family protein [Halobacteriovoraceae bacterium]|jgi:uncharacterized protein (TIGR02147 family)|nr:TIGR02147 family protein [Halobacteriovoraceae bacterium]
MREQPLIEGHSDYRSFLKHYYEYRKELRPGFSFKVWANKLGLKSSSSLIMILKGQRTPSDSLVHKLNDYFDFNTKQRAYFEGIVLLERNQNRPQLYQRIKKDLPRFIKKSKISLDSFKIMSDWEYFAVREMLLLKDFTPNLEYLSKRITGKISAKKIGQILETLESLKLIKNYKQSDVHIETDTDTSSLAIKKYHKQIMDLIKRSLDEDDVKDRDITGTSFCMKKEYIDQVKIKIEKFQDELVQEFEAKEGEGEELYHLETAFIPLTK